MANVELTGRPQRLPDQPNTRINDVSSQVSNERVSPNHQPLSHTDQALMKQNSDAMNRNSINSSTVRRSPFHMGSHPYQSNPNVDAIKRQDLLESQIKTRSTLRRRCYRLKYDMIVSPMKNFIACTVAGFLFNLPIMGSIIIVYEKVRNL